MFKKMLVPLDGSESANKVLPYVRTLAVRLDAEVILMQVPVHPLDDLLFTGPKLAAATHHQAEAMRPAGVNYLEQVAAELRANGLNVATQVCEGVVADTILECADKLQADLIVLSAHGRGGELWLPIGSVSYEIVHRSRVPILLI